MPDQVRTPAKAWNEMVRGNERFVRGEPAHPRQDVERRTEIALAQTPHAALFGCSDSRLSAEIIFDKGLGDLFVVRNAGQVISESVVGSLEYAVSVLKVPLIVVLGHDACGAVSAAIDSVQPNAAPLPRTSASVSVTVPSNPKSPLAKWPANSSPFARTASTFCRWRVVALRVTLAIASFTRLSK